MRRHKQRRPRIPSHIHNVKKQKPKKANMSSQSMPSSGAVLYAPSDDLSNPIREEK